MPGVPGSSRHSADGVPLALTVTSSDSSHIHLLMVTPPSSSLAVACTAMPTSGCLWDRTHRSCVFPVHHLDGHIQGGQQPAGALAGMGHDGY